MIQIISILRSFYLNSFLRLGEVQGLKSETNLNTSKERLHAKHGKAKLNLVNLIKETSLHATE